MRLRRLRDLIPVSTGAIALWAWANREEVVDWTAFGVRALRDIARGNRHDPLVELRLRAALLDDRRTRRAAGLDLQVRDGIAIFTGLVPAEIRDVACYHAERTEGVTAVDDRVQLLPTR